MQSRAFRRHANVADLLFFLLLVFLFSLISTAAGAGIDIGGGGGKRSDGACGWGRTRQGRGGLGGRGDRAEDTDGDKAVEGRR